MSTNNMIEVTHAGWVAMLNQLNKKGVPYYLVGLSASEWALESSDVATGYVARLYVGGDRNVYRIDPAKLTEALED